MKYLSILLLGLVLSCKETTQYKNEVFIIREKISVRMNQHFDNYYFKSINSKVIRVQQIDYVLFDEGDTLIIRTHPSWDGITEIKNCKRNRKWKQKFTIQR